MRNLILIATLPLYAACTTTYGGNIYAKAGSYVKHHKGSNWNEGFNNNGVGVEAEIAKQKLKSGEIVYSIGGLSNKNSYNKQSYNAHGAVKYCNNVDKLRACGGVVAGGATGYKDQSGMSVTPFAGATASVEYDRVGVDFLAVPSVGKITGFFAAIFKIKVLEW
jgi:hypothetical protein